MGWPDIPTHAPEPEAKSETLSIDEFLNIDTCADCKDDILDDDFKTCSCGTTVLHAFCFKICAHCSESLEHNLCSRDGCAASHWTRSGGRMSLML